MKLTQISVSEFDLAKTLDSGQVFHWERLDRGFCGTIGDLPVYIEQRENMLVLGGERVLGSTVAHYFALDHPLADICRSLPDDPVMAAARKFCHGLRIIRQAKWECLATFICSSMKQVAHIRQISKELREQFGNAHRIKLPELEFTVPSDLKVFSFPTAQRLAESSEKELRECALGYRAKNLLETARLVAKRKVDLAKMSSLCDRDLREALCRLPGVGAKVANCVMLFAYERLRAFPIDVWIDRTLRENYFPRARKLNAARLRTFTDEYFGEHGGYAQQYLFHFARKSGWLSGRSPHPSNLSRSNE
jgi:N-glycosylase/DNA lyase